MNELEAEAHKPAGCSHAVMRRLSDNEIVTVAQFNEGPVFDDHGWLVDRDHVLDLMELLYTLSHNVDQVHFTNSGIHFNQWNKWSTLKPGECLILSGDDGIHIRDAGHVSRNYSNKLHYSGQL